MYLPIVRYGRSQAGNASAQAKNERITRPQVLDMSTSIVDAAMRAKLS
jgi:hypothetical protein